MAENTQNERDIRIQKIDKIRSWKVIPYAQSFSKKDNIIDIIQNHQNKNFREIEEIIKSTEIQINTAGRIMLHRSHGKILFARLLDNTAQIQIMLHRDNCKIIDNKGNSTSILKNEKGEELSAYKFFEKLVDLGDFIGITGEVFKTHKGELTIFASEFKFISKTIRPLPEKFHGIQNQESMYRQRYLDLTMNENSYQRFVLRSKFLQIIRNFYYKENFLEVETSVLGNSASGAAAQPFITHHNDFDIDMYLRISPETALKKLTAGRFEKVFEVAKDFRNEGSDPSHHQEFTMIEHYSAYWNFEDNMKFTERMFDYIFTNIPELNKKIKVKDKLGNEKEVNFQTPRQRIDYIAQIKKDCGIDVSKYGPEDEKKLRDLIKSKGFSREGLEIQSTATMIDYLYKKVTRPKIIGPAFIYNYPKTMQPLARVSDVDNNIVEQRQLLINGREVIKAYSELVDPLLQQSNFEAQSDALVRGDEEATSGDDEFVLAMEHGMPCQSGRGMGIDRIFAMLTGQENIRDVILFPLMKPEGIKNNTKKEIDKNNNFNTQKKEFLPSNLIPKAEELAEKYLTDTKKHCYQVANIMKFFAKKLGEDENLRYIAGLLHDVDWDYIGKDSSKHVGKEFEKIIENLKAEIKDDKIFNQLKNDIKSHAHFLTDIQPETLMARYLCSVDELSGLIYAYSLMRPTGIEGMKVKSIKKKIKDKSFASGVDRNEIKNCEKFLNINLDDFISDIIEAMQE